MATFDAPFRWGILGPGKIAHQFAASLQYCEKPARLEAVGSRSLRRAQDFASEFGDPRAYGSYSELAEDSGIDAVYIATPHSEHAGNALLCLGSGKPVLVEKPFTVNASEAASVIVSARERRLFCMEAMWTRFFPATRHLGELAFAGAVGKLRMIMADFGFRAEYDAESRLFDPKLAGGGLLDVGIYPLSLACMLLGEPVSASIKASFAPSGVDDSAAFLLQHGGNKLSLLSCATRVRTLQQAVVIGEEGSIRLNSEWWRPNGLTITRPGQTDEIVALPYPGVGFQFEADEAQRCIRAGQLESPIMPLDETSMLMRVLDELRSQIGLVYPGESAGN